jgi:two-component sensor histidine kinase
MFVDIVVQPMTEANGEISGIFVEGVDVTEHVHAERHLLLMNAELQHRVKNTLSIVGGIASQTLHQDLTDATLETFQDRLRALGRAQDILTATSQPRVSVRDVVENALAPHRMGKERIAVSGLRVILGAKEALSLGMAIHEMATNAIKYGALSNDRGRIDISWRKTLDRGAPVFKFSWVESGGPLIDRPSRKGFGSELIEGRLAWDFKGRVEVSYEPTGFKCRLIASMGNLGGPPPSENFRVT